MFLTSRKNFPQQKKNYSKDVYYATFQKDFFFMRTNSKNAKKLKNDLKHVLKNKSDKIFPKEKGYGNFFALLSLLFSHIVF